MFRPLLIAALALVLALPVAATAGPGDILNRFRAQNGLPAVRHNPTLERVATAHARDMVRGNFFGHKGSNGGGVAQRAKRHGYNYCRVAENLAKGHTSAEAAMKGWISSRGHRRNMLLRDIREYALVRAPGNIWVMVLGRRGC